MLHAHSSMTAAKLESAVRPLLRELRNCLIGDMAIGAVEPALNGGVEEAIASGGETDGGALRSCLILMDWESNSEI